MNNEKGQMSIHLLICTLNQTYLQSAECLIIHQRFGSHPHSRHLNRPHRPNIPTALPHTNSKIPIQKSPRLPHRISVRQILHSHYKAHGHTFQKRARVVPQLLTVISGEFVASCAFCFRCHRIVRW